ncbi:EbsA family protein [Ligilactobacillus equi]|uniref:EbsA family protein n=1 Tax=Ligilactobacillus equi TaxID=137357 RepID=UPI002ED2F0BF
MKKYYYQPNIAVSVISWSYTGIIFLIAMLLWLEITVLQIWTLLVLALFLFLIGVQIWRRWVEVTEKGLIFHSVISFNNVALGWKKIRKMEYRYHQLIIKTKFKEYHFLLGRKAGQNLLEKWYQSR